MCHSVLTEPKVRINRFYYELAVCDILQEKLDCKAIWVKGAYRYRNPDDDLPQDFDENKDYYFNLLQLPTAADTYINDIKQRMRDGLDALHRGLVNTRVNNRLHLEFDLI